MDGEEGCKGVDLKEWLCDRTCSLCAQRWRSKEGDWGQEEREEAEEGEEEEEKRKSTHKLLVW